MRTISGSVVSTSRVSLPDAAAILTDFAASDTGASEAVSVYITRAADAFNHLVQFHNHCSQGHQVRMKSSVKPETVKKEEEEEEAHKGSEGNHISKKHKKKLGNGKIHDSDSRNGMNVKMEEHSDEKKNQSKIKEKVKTEDKKPKISSSEIDGGTKKKHKKSHEGNEGSERDTFSVETKKRKGEVIEEDAHSSKRRKSKKHKVEGK